MGHQLFADMLEQAQAADRLGYLGVTITGASPDQIRFIRRGMIFHIEGSKFQKTIVSYYCTVKLHVSDSALPPLVSEAITFQ